MRDETRRVAAFAALALGACASTGPVAGGAGGVAGRDSGREFIVSCSSAAAWDIGGCSALAAARCEGGRAQWLGTLASTYVKANNLYLTTARYLCPRA